MLPRRQFLHLAAGAAALPAAPRIARAESYPARPVRLIVGFAPGGPTDIVARLIGQRVSERVGHPFVVENRPGAGSNAAAEAVVRAAPDGYTLLAMTTANTVNATLYDNLSFDIARDLAPVAGIVRMPGVMEVNPLVPVRTCPEFIAYARASAGKINMATGGHGSAPDIYGALFKVMAGVNLVAVAYRGSGPALTELLAGHVQVMFDLLASSLGHIKPGRLRAFAVATARRLEVLPDIPTVAELVPGYEASSWTGLVAPKDAPAEIVDKLNSEVNT